MFRQLPGWTSIHMAMSDDGWLTRVADKVVWSDSYSRVCAWPPTPLPWQSRNRGAIEVGIRLPCWLRIAQRGWTGYEVLSRTVHERLGRARRWAGYITVWNWCNVVQYALLLLGSLPVLLHAPEPVSQTAALVALGWALWLEWFATRLALDLPGLAAAALVTLDLSVGLLLAGAAGI